MAYELVTTTRYRLLTAVLFIGPVSTVVVSITDIICLNAAAVVSALELFFAARFKVTSSTFAHLPRYIQKTDVNACVAYVLLTDNKSTIIVSIDPHCWNTEARVSALEPARSARIYSCIRATHDTPGELSGTKCAVANVRVCRTILRICSV